MLLALCLIMPQPVSVLAAENNTETLLETSVMQETAITEETENDNPEKTETEASETEPETETEMQTEAVPETETRNDTAVPARKMTASKVSEPETEKETETETEEKNGWYGWNYYENGKMVTNRFITIGKKTYLFSKVGKPCCGITTWKGKNYYFDDRSGVMKTGLLHLGDQWHYADHVTGAFLTGWQSIPNMTKAGTRKVYFNEDGEMLFGLQTVAGKTYYFNKATGEVKTGLQHIDNRYYYFNEKTGAALTGWQKIPYSATDKRLKKVYFDTDGTMTFGEKKINGKWYYFNPRSGEMMTGWQTIPCGNNRTKRVYYRPEGYMIYGMQTIGGARYYLHPKSGAMQTGWQTVDGKKYYFDHKTGKMWTGLQTIGGKKYRFDTATGALLDGWVKQKNTKRVYDYDQAKYVEKPVICYYVNTNKVTGWQTIGGKRYYFDSDCSMHYGALYLGQNGTYCMDMNTGAMVTGFKTIRGKLYYYGGDGKRREWLQQVGGKWYLFYPADGADGPGWERNQDQTKSLMYFTKDHSAASGWTTINGRKFYFNQKGVAYTGLKKIGTQTYYLGDYGVMHYGWQWIGGKWYYFDTKTGVMATGKRTISGKTYTFDSAGVCKNRSDKASAAWQENRKVQEEMVRFTDDNMRMKGHLYISGLLNVRLVQPVKWGTQFITDCDDTAAWIDNNKIFIADHVHEEFCNLNKVKKGTTAYITTGSSRTNYVCIETGTGRRDGMYLYDKSGKRINDRKDTAICTYTCQVLSSGRVDTTNVFYALWKKK